MTTERYLVSENLRLDRLDERVWLAGDAVRLGGKSFGLLRTLMERPQMLVTKDEIFDQVWNGLAVSDSVLTTAVKELRQALGDDARASVWIETVHRRGYRFMLPVVPNDGTIVADTINVPNPEASQPNKRRTIWVVLTALLILSFLASGSYLLFSGDRASQASQNANAKSVAVLPFRDITANGETGWLAEGLTEEVHNRLIMTPDLQVVSRLSSAGLRNGSGNLSEKARRLGVAHVLDGSVRHAGDRVRVTVELVRAEDGLRLWAQAYDRRADDIISIQEDIALRIATALQTVMEPAKLRAMVAVGTQSVDAYQHYLQAVAADQRSLATGSRADAEIAAACYEKARQADPNFAKAHWRAAQSWFGKATRIHGSVNQQGLSDEQRIVEYRERVQRAIDASINDVERLKYLSAKALMDVELRSAHQLMVQYLKARPRDIDAWEDMAELAAYADEQAWLIRAGERIHTLSLQAKEPRSRAITVTTMAMQLPEAVARAREQMRLRPKSVMIRYQSHRALIWAGEIDEARQSIDDIVDSQLPEANKLLAQMRQACAEGRNGDAMQLRERIDRPGTSISNRWQAAQIAGDREGAVRLLQPLDNQRGLPTLLQFLINPSFDTIRFPFLSATIARDNIVRSEVWPMPGACTIKAIASAKDVGKSGKFKPTVR